MRIGILTFHKVPNYGAALQAFALETYISGLNHTVQIIDFKCPGNDDKFSPEYRKAALKRIANPLKRLVKNALYELFVRKHYHQKFACFNEFSREYHSLYMDLENTFNVFDVVFCGSDQIWNPYITAGFQDTYFGGVGNRRAVVASYAASCGDISEFNDAHKDEFLHRVQNIDYVGVREKSLHQFLLKNGVSSSCTVDPTFLLSMSEYVEKLGLNHKQGKKYILQYSLQKSKTLDLLSQKIAKDKGLKIINICGYDNIGINTRKIFNAGPKEFMDYLYNAEYVVTNSFHGVALSLIFRKDFNVCLPKLRKGRIVDLLETLSLSNRIYLHNSEPITSKIDYNRVSAELDKMVDSSRAFIFKVLETEHE